VLLFEVAVRPTARTFLFSREYSLMNKKILAAFSVATLLGIAAVPASSANLILNGSFEIPQSAIPAPVGLGNDPGVLLTDWNSTTDNANPGNPFLQNYLFATSFDKVSDGNQAVLFNGDGAANLTLSQTFATSAGTPYEVKFDLSRQTDDNDSFQAPFTAQVTGSPVQSYVTPGGAAAEGYVTETFFFVATGNSTTLTFTAPTYSDSSANSPELDNVIVNSVPEPSSLMALCGLVAAGLLCGRKALVRQRARKLADG
jgi:hypothetical protein